MSQKILKKHIAFITAHPDDETYLAGGTIYRNNIEGGTNSLFCASLGEKGTAYLKNPLSQDEMKNLRRNELNAVAKLLGMNNIEIGKFPDGQIENNIVNIYNSALRFVEKYKPNVLVSFGEDGFTGHNDHIAIAKIAEKLSKETSITLFTFSKPPHHLYPDFNTHLFKKRKNGSYANINKHKDPEIKIKINSKVKLNALKLHDSQFFGLNPHNNFPKEIAKHILSYEYFCTSEQIL